MTLRTKPTFTILAVALILAVGAAWAADAPEWPRFHGPKGDNISTETGLLTSWPEGGPKLLGTAKGLGEGFAGVTIADGMIYTVGNVEDKMVVTALDLNGRRRWQVDNGEAWTKNSNGSRGTPTVDGDRVYHESPLGNLVCLNAKTGKKIWSTNILEQFHGENIEWGLSESVLVDGDRLICCPGGKETAVVALDKLTGKTVWKSPSASGDAIGYASPLLAECKGLRMILTMTLKAVIGVNADNGELLFRFENPTKYDVNATMPLYHDGHVLISSGYGTTGTTLLKLDVQGKKAGVTKVWNSRELDNHHGGVILWDGWVYGAAHDFNRGSWICLDWKTGEKKYAEKGVGKGSATCAQGMLYTLSESRDVGLVKATPDGHKLISKFKIPSQGEGPSWAHPVICGGRLYIRHGDFLYAYDVRGK